MQQAGMSMQLYNDFCAECGRFITQTYSTSFTWGIRAFAPRFRQPIYSIYGFVRLADEIVDTFYGQNQAELLEEFSEAARLALQRGFSLNPILQAFGQTVHRYNIDRQFINAFLDSMGMDLHPTNYTPELYNSYIYGSAEAVGLMCLTVFCEGNAELFRQLAEPARKLGAAFQKVNFLRDLKSDYEQRGRVYFPGMSFAAFDEAEKRNIEDDIKADFEAAYAGIVRLPKGVRLGVYTAYRYYLALFDKIRGSSPQMVLDQRIRVGNDRKLLLFFRSFLKERWGLPQLD